MDKSSPGRRGFLKAAAPVGDAAQGAVGQTAHPQAPPAAEQEGRAPALPRRTISYPGRFAAPISL